MDLLLVAARLLLAAVFAVAGVAKLLDRAGSRQAVVEFGVPSALASQVAFLLPVAELTVAVALLSVPTAWWGAVGALVLLAAFIGGIGVNLARGRTPTCRCFGQIGAGPVGRATIVRNLAFAAVAAPIVWLGRDNPGPSLVGWAADLSTAERVSLGLGVVGLVLLGSITVLLVQVLSQQGRLLVRIEVLERQLAANGEDRLGEASSRAFSEGLPVGASAPPFELPDLHGEAVTLDSLLTAGRPALLVFTDPACAPCATLLPDLGRWQRELANRLAVAVVSRGAAEQNRARLAEHGLASVLLQRDDEVADAYRAFETPMAVLVLPDGTIGSPLAAGPDQIRALLAHTLAVSDARRWNGLDPLPMAGDRLHDHDHEHDASRAVREPVGRPPILGVGDPVPSWELADLEGGRIALSDFKGHPTVLLFWSPECGFCQQLLPELRTWEAIPSRPASMALVSGGSVEANRAMGLATPVLLDEQFAVGSAFGARGTPSAVMLDGQGRIASDLAVGSEAVLALASSALGRSATQPSALTQEHDSSTNRRA